MTWNEVLATEIAKGIISTHVEGWYDSVAKSTAYEYPSIGVSQWEGNRADSLLSKIDGGEEFIGLSYASILNFGKLDRLKEVLRSESGKKAQLEVLSSDCMEYVDSLKRVPTLDDTRCFIYAGIWCPTSTYVVCKFLQNRAAENYNLRSLKTLRNLFRDRYYISAGVGEYYRYGYANRAENTYQYVAGIDLTTPYGIPAYNGK